MTSKRLTKQERNEVVRYYTIISEELKLIKNQLPIKEEHIDDYKAIDRTVKIINQKIDKIIGVD